MIPLIYPRKKGNFYYLNDFFTHIHCEESASQLYAIPWDNSLVIVPKRDGGKAGCVGCAARRLISSTYHKTGKIYGIDSVWCNTTTLEETISFKNLEHNNISSTKCYIYKFDTMNFEEIHVLPVPACTCSALPFPSLTEGFIETWMQKWPNAVLQKTLARPSTIFLHLHSAKLPNVAPLFISNKTTLTCVPSSPTVAALRDEANLSKRLLGESLERYALHYVPLERLFTSPDKSSALSVNKFSNINPPLWTQIKNTHGKEIFFPADKVFSGLHKLYSVQFAPLSSSGVAAHTDFDLAKTHALLELIERDALLIAWRLADQINLFRKIPANLSETREKAWVEKLLSQQEQELSVLAVENQFNIPLILAVSFPRSASCKYAPNFGSGIAFSWEVAYKKALKEILQGIAIPDSEICEDAPAFFVERPRYWAHSQRLPILSKRINASEDVNVHHNTYSLGILIEKFNQLALPLYFADLTTPDLTRSNWRIIRAICPDFEPFASNAHHENPNLKRVNHFLDSINKKPVNNLNIDPFPFP